MGTTLVSARDGVAVVVELVKKNIGRIINETQIIMHAAEEGRQDVIDRALVRIKDITEKMKSEPLNGC